MGRAYAVERSPAARDAIAQILTNSRLCAEGHRPICQDTGIVVVFVKVGMGVTWDAKLDLEAMINEGVRRAYSNPENKLRASIVVGSGIQARQYPRQHAGGHPHGVCAGRWARHHGGRERRRFREQIHVRHVESVGFGGRLGVGDGAGDGRGLVPSRDARRGHRRQRREGHAAGQKIADGAHRYRRAADARRANPSSRSCVWKSTGASMRSASARKGWAV